MFIQKYYENFEKYNLWAFFSIQLSYLLKEFIKELSRHLNKEIKISIRKDKQFYLGSVKKQKWLLVKNNVSGTTSGKLRFLISEEDYGYLETILKKTTPLPFFKSIAARLKKLTMVDEITSFTASQLADVLTLGNQDKYFAIYITLKIEDKNIAMLMIVRDEMLLFPLGRINLNFISTLTDYYFKKAFIELDKKIIWDGMELWDEELKKRMAGFISTFPVKKSNLKPSNNPISYKIFLQYLYLLKLLSLDNRKLK